jgi:uncharacterized protein YbbC (DUF1343 family)
MTMNRVVTGLEVLLETPSIVSDRPWALLANQAAVTSTLDPARAVLSSAINGELVRLLAPEHGLDGVAQDMEAVGHEIDGLTGVEVHSLYGTDADSLRPAVEDLGGAEVVVVDLPDIGSRYYTFAATMDAVMAACEPAGIEVVVLDRPNPIGGVLREGGPVTPGFESFVSQIEVPIRHGLSLGELALAIQRDRYPTLELTVVACRGWRRSRWWDETGLPWVPPSPNMPTLETAAVYPGLCLVEATSLSEGRGTTTPFHLVGAPEVDAGGLVRRLRDVSPDGVAFRTASFRPMFGKHAGVVCSGVELHLTDRRTIRPVALGVHLLRAFRETSPAAFDWRREAYEFVSDIPAIDLLTGSEDARRVIEGQGTVEDLVTSWQPYLEEFEATLDGVLLYHEE